MKGMACTLCTQSYTYLVEQLLLVISFVVPYYNALRPRTKGVQN